MTYKVKKPAGTTLGAYFRGNVLEDSDVRKYQQPVSNVDARLADALFSGYFDYCAQRWPVDYESFDHIHWFQQSNWRTLTVETRFKLTLEHAARLRFGDGTVHTIVQEAFEVISQAVRRILVDLRTGDRIAIGRDLLGDEAKIPAIWWKAAGVWFDIADNIVLAERSAAQTDSMPKGRRPLDEIFRDVVIFEGEAAPDLPISRRKPHGQHKWVYRAQSGVRTIGDKIKHALEINGIDDPAAYFNGNKERQSEFARWLDRETNHNNVGSIRSTLVNLIRTWKAERES